MFGPHPGPYADDPLGRKPAERSRRRIAHLISIYLTYITRENSVDLACAHAHLLAARYLKNRSKIEIKSGLAFENRS